MKKFRWPLQRLLDVTVQRETVLRTELLTMLPAIAAAQQDIASRKAQVRTMLSELAREDLQKRLPRQQLAMSNSHTSQRLIDHLSNKVRRLEMRRDEKVKVFSEVRASRERLQKLRSKAYEEYLQQQARLEQKLLDESSQNSHIRKTRERQMQLAVSQSTMDSAAAVGGERSR